MKYLSVEPTLGIFIAVILASGCAGSPNSSGTGGNNGGGGSTCLAGEADLISDFKMDNSVYPSDNRQGGWYVYGDNNGTFTPPKVGMDPYPIDSTAGGPCSGAGSLHLKATGFNLWGAAAATDFKPTTNMIKSPYDATKYKGISFWAKAAKVLTGVQVKFPDVNTDPEVADSKCVLAAGAPNNCSPYIVKLGGDSQFPTYTASIGVDWKRFDILFADSRQDQYNAGYHPANNMLDAANLLGFAVQVNANFSTSPVSANDFEIWIDDAYFIK